MSVFRSLASIAALVLAALVLPIAVLAPWVDRVAADTDAFVERAGPLSEDPSVQAAARRVLMAEARQTFPPRALPRVRTAVNAAVAGPRFDTVWERGLGAAHEQLIAALADDGSPVDDDGVIRIPLRPLLLSVVAELDPQGNIDPQSIPPLEVSYRLASAHELSRARAAYQIVDSAGVVAPIAWLVLAVGAIGLARRRRLAVFALAMSSALMLAVVWLSLGFARGLVIDWAPPVNQDLIEAIWDGLVGGLRTGVLVGAAAAALIGVVAAGIGLAGRGRR